MLKVNWFKCIFVGLIVFLTGCAQHQSLHNNTMILPYADFGPPSMSGRLLGVEWFQWQPHGDSRPRKYDVNIVVYRNISLAEVEKMYPISIEKQIDYRYVTYLDTIRYFNENITDVLQMKEEGYPMGTLADRLQITKNKIIEVLGE